MARTLSVALPNTFSVAPFNDLPTQEDIDAIEGVMRYHYDKETDAKFYPDEDSQGNGRLFFSLY